MPSPTDDPLAPALAHVQRHCDRRPAVALVLGSGLGGFAESFGDAARVAYQDIPGMPRPRVAGHAGQLVFGRCEGLDVVAMQGRVHLYEGHAPQEVVFGVRLMARLGAETLIVTNAAGGLDPALSCGALLCIEDHINLTGANCLVGPNDPALGPRFPDMSRAYDPALRGLARQAADELGIALQTGVYAGVLGPSYETPAEVRMLRQLGARAVGMSTVQEVIAARHVGLAVLGVSCITNLAAGLTDEPLSHADVQEAAQRATADMERLVRGVLRRLPRQGEGAG